MVSSSMAVRVAEPLATGASLTASILIDMVAVSVISAVAAPVVTV